MICFAYNYDHGPLCNKAFSHAEYRLIFVELGLAGSGASFPGGLLALLISQSSVRPN